MRDKRAGAASRRLVETVFRRTSACLAILDRDYRFVRVNDAWARHFGLSVEHLPGLSCPDVLPAGAAPHRAATLAALDEALRTGRPTRTGAQPLASATQPERATTYWDCSIEPITDDAGRVEYLFVSALDVTQRVEAERAARNGERRRRELMEALPVALYATDANGRLTFYNDAAVALWGRTPEAGEGRWCGCEAPGLHWSDGRPLKRDETPMALAARDGLTLRGAEAVLERPDGSRVTFVPYTTPLHDARGRPAGAVNVLIDISERKRIEAALAESEERFRTAFECAGIGMGLLAIDGRWLRANRSLCAMLGYTEDELRQSTYQALTHPDDLARGQELARRLIAGEIPRMQLEKRYRRADGSYLWARLTTSIVRAHDGEALYYVSQIEDIQARKEVEDRLALLDYALDQVHEGAFLIDAHARFRWVNEEASRSLGYSRDELVGMGVPDIDPDWPSARWAGHWRNIRISGRLTFESRHRTRAGREFPVEITASYFEYGGEGYNLALARDITERKRAEAALRESETRYRELFDHSPDAVFTVDATPDGRLEFGLGNTVWERMTGLDGARLAGQCVDAALAPDAADVALEPYRRCLRDGVPVSYEEERATPDGCRHFYTTLTPLRAGAGGGRVFGVARDVTERKRAAEEWALTFDALDAAVIVLDEQRRVVRMNQPAAALAGCAAPEAVGRRLDEWVTGEPWSTGLAQLAELDSSPAGALRGTVRAGACTWDVEVHGLPRPASLAPRARVVLILRDLSRLVALQESVRRAEQMAAVGSLVAGVAHEVRNPLFAISVNIDALAAELPGHPELVELIEALRAERDRLNALMSELLAYGRPVPEARTLLPLEPVLAGAVRSCTDLARRRGVRIEREGEVAALALMDPGRLEQVFENLIDNACRHAPAGGVVEVAAAREEGPSGPLLRVEVRDRGPGFAPDVLPHVFEPFFTRRRGGTGLGLAIAQRNAEAHGGRLSAGNRPGGGAVLCVELPLATDAGR